MNRKDGQLVLLGLGLFLLLGVAASCGEAGIAGNHVSDERFLTATIAGAPALPLELVGSDGAVLGTVRLVRGDGVYFDNLNGESFQLWQQRPESDFLALSLSDDHFVLRVYYTGPSKLLRGPSVFLRKVAVKTGEISNQKISTDEWALKNAEMRRQLAKKK